MGTQYPPLAIWSATDHSSAVIIVTTLCLFYWLIPGILQQATTISSRGFQFKWSEAIFVLSMIIGIVQSSLVLVGCHYGLGKSIRLLSVDDIAIVERYVRASNVLYALVLGLVKCAVTLFIANLTVNDLGSLHHASRKHKTALGTIIGLSIAWTIGSIIAVAVSCDSPAVCLQKDSLTGIFVADAITDLLIAIYAGSVIWRTQAAFRLRLAWYFPFCLRLCVPTLAGMRLMAFMRVESAADPTLSAWLFVDLGQIQIFLSLIGYTSPALKKTMIDLATNYGAVNELQTTFRHRPGGSYALKDLRYLKDTGGSGWRSLAMGRNTLPLASSSSRADPVVEADSDGDSQKGIMRRE